MLFLRSGDLDVDLFLLLRRGERERDLDFFLLFRRGDFDLDLEGDLRFRVLERDLDLERLLRTGDLVRDRDRRFLTGDDRRRGDFDFDFRRRDLDPDRDRAFERELFERPREPLRRERDLDLERRDFSSPGDAPSTFALITRIPQLAEVGLFTASRPVRKGFLPAAIRSLSGFTIGLFACSTLRHIPPKNTPLY